MGTTFRIRAAGVLTSGATGGTSTFRIRFGTSSLSGNIPTSIAPANQNGKTNFPFTFEALVTVRATGGSGSVIGECWVEGSDISNNFTFASPSHFSSTTTATVALATNANKVLELTYISGNAGTTATFHVATIELVRA